MMWASLFLGWVYLSIAYTQSDEKVPYKRATICNVEAYFNVRRTLSINRFFCVPDSLCRKDVHRSPLMSHDGCDGFMESPRSPERLVCCHQEEILEDLVEHFQNVTHVTGLKSFLMCKDFSQGICGPKGSYCEDDATEPDQFKGLPTAISKYPHTALIGYFHFTENIWHWFCQGSIVSKTYILTVWSCMTDGDETATNVKIGESRICHLDYCPDHEEEQNLQIISKLRQSSSSDRPTDLVLLEVATIRFNRKVRPACLFYQTHTLQSQGWFARYSKQPEELIKTRPGKRPLFMVPQDKNVIAFKVKTAGEARILFSRTGLPYRKEFRYEIVLGSANNGESMITRSDAPNFSRPPTPINITTQILSSEQFRGFWINVHPHEVNVGKEDSEDPFLVYYDGATAFNLSAMGISTPNSSGDWIVHDYRTSMSLHDFEMEVTYADECKEALGDSVRQEDEEIKDTSVFCARGEKKRGGVGGIQFGPCDNDWGGAIQIQDERLFCMWQIFGVVLREGPQNCSALEKPSLFKSLNKPAVLNWLEETIFSNFSILDLNLERPKCVGSN